MDPKAGTKSKPSLGCRCTHPPSVLGQSAPLARKPIARPLAVKPLHLALIGNLLAAFARTGTGRRHKQQQNQPHNSSGTTSKLQKASATGMHPATSTYLLQCATEHRSECFQMLRTHLSQIQPIFRQFVETCARNDSASATVRLFRSKYV